METLSSKNPTDFPRNSIRNWIATPRPRTDSLSSRFKKYIVSQSHKSSKSVYHASPSTPHHIFKATIIEPPEWNHHTIQQLINHPLGSFYRISLAFPTPFDIWPPSVSIRLTLFTLTVVTLAQWLWFRPGRGRREIQLPLESTTPLLLTVLP